MSEVNGGKYAPLPGKIPGRLVNLGGHELVLAPLSLQQVEALESTIIEIGKAGAGLKDQMAVALPIILASLQRNYADMTADELRGLLDVGNVREALEAVIDISGYKRAAPGEMQPASQ